MSQRVAAVVRDWQAQGPFRAAAICEEVNRRYAGAVKKPASVPTVRKYLLRLSRRGVIRAVREGMPYAESLFQKV